MTHDLTLYLVFDTLEKAQKFAKVFEADYEFQETYLLYKDKYNRPGYRQYGDQQPFIRLSTRADTWKDKKYRIWIESGSHVGFHSPREVMYVLQWYYFTLAFLHRYTKQVKIFSCEQYYKKSGDDEKITIPMMRDGIQDLMNKSTQKWLK